MREQHLGNTGRMSFVNFFSRMLILYGTALILLFYSEFFFLNEGPVQEVLRILAGAENSSFLGILEFSFFYALFAIWLLLPIYYFRIRSLWGLYLAGGFFGIATEGLVIPLIYTESLVWPALSWHVLADVLLGWFFVRWILMKNNPILTIPLAMSLGLCWACWALWTHVGEEPFILRPGQFTGFALCTGAGLLAGYALLNLVREREFKPTRIELAISALITLALWVPMLIQAWLPMFAVKPVNTVMLPIYLLASLFTLYRHSKVETRESLLTVFRDKIAWWNLSLFGLMPVTAVLAYPFIWRNELFPPTVPIVVLLDRSSYVLTPLAIFMLWREIQAGAHRSAMVRKRDGT